MALIIDGGEIVNEDIRSKKVIEELKKCIYNKFAFKIATTYVVNEIDIFSRSFLISKQVDFSLNSCKFDYETQKLVLIFSNSMKLTI